MPKRILTPAVVVLGFFACSPAKIPVAELSIEPQEIVMPYPQFVNVSLDWRITGTLGDAAGQPRVFLHLVDADGEVVRTFDHDFPRRFETGAEVGYSVELSQSALVPALADGEYALTAGLYDSAGTRWPLVVDGEEVAENEYRIATVTAMSGSETPKFFFSPSWLPVEGGTDMQVLARRWLESDGVLRLTDVPSAGTLRIGIGIPQADGPQELVLDESASQPTIRVETTCSDYSTEVSGSDSHIVAIPVSVTGEESACDLTFSANYYLLSRDNMSRRTMALEELSWSSAP
jgi:hypothetical protein